MTYVPKVNDYVIWDLTKNIEGWVYFKGEEYITIETAVSPKDKTNYECCSLHKNNRLLVVCYASQWKELEYVKTRQSIYEGEKNCMEIAS